jgi:enoyl-CoA hydratase/carnithine racemase
MFRRYLPVVRQHLSTGLPQQLVSQAKPERIAVSHRRADLRGGGLPSGARPPGRPQSGLDAAVGNVIAALMAGAPRSQSRAKRLIAEVADRPVDEVLEALTARSIAESRASAEGREGIAAFLEKRKPSWR